MRYRTENTFVGKMLLSLLVVGLLVLLVACFPLSAWADDETTADAQSANTNKVYPNQMPDSSFLYEISIAELAGADSFYDGQTVMVQGEVVGDRVNDELNGNKCWITLQETGADNPSVVAVSMTKDQSNIIDTYGRYGQTGTILQVRGTFNLDCDDHQGESDIHVDEVSAVAQGSTQQQEVNSVVVGAGIACIVLGLALTALYYYLRERAR